MQALGLAQRDTPLPTWYPADAEPRAQALAALVGESMHWLQERLSLPVPLNLALLTAPAWAELITWQPYGIPGVAGQPAVIFMPADDEGLAAREALALEPLVAPDTRRALADAGYTYAEAARRYVDLVGLHEVGHLAMRRLGLWADGRPASRWLDETMATAVGYAFLDERHPRLAAMWDGVLQAHLDAVKPTHRTLEAFDQRYLGVGALNYVWFQARFQQLARQATHDRAMGGVAFVREVAAAFGRRAETAQRAAEVVERLARVYPPARAWAERGLPG